MVSLTFLWWLMQGPHRAAPASSGASHHKQQAWNPSSFIALRGIDMRIAIRTKPLNHMNPRTRGFKMNGINHLLWGGGIHGPTLSMTTPFLPPTNPHLVCGTFTNVPMDKEPFILIPNHPEANSLQRLHSFLASHDGNLQHITQGHSGISVRKKKHISAKPWVRSPLLLGSCQLEVFPDLAPWA